MTVPRLPEGFGVALDAAVRRPRPDVLIGGAPLRLLRLTDVGAKLVDSWVAGDPVPEGRGAQALARRLLDAGIAHPRPPAYAPTAVVVIPVRHDAAGLERTRSALVGLDVIVVDDNSSFPAGPAATRNTGWRQAQAEVVVFVDAGCRPQPGWLDRLLPHFADPAVGAVAPRIVSEPAPGTPGWLASYDRQRSSLDLGPREAPVRPGSRVSYVPTAALAVRRTALEHAGGFDEHLRYGEDVDLVWRLDGLGWWVRYDPAATVLHPSRADVRSWLLQRFHYGRSAADLAARHGDAVAPLAISPWSAAAWALTVGGYPAAGSLLAAGTAAALARQGVPGTRRSLARLAATGHLRAGAGLATAVRRAWLPPAIVLAALAWAAGKKAPAWWLGVSLTGPLPRLADDLAYQAGVWTGVIGRRSAAALCPRT